MDFVARDDPRPLIPEGDYDAVFTREEECFCFGSRKQFLYFEIITPGPHVGTELFMAFNINYKGEIAECSKYYKCWCLANNWHRPSRNAVMSPRIFKNKTFKVSVKTIRPEHNGEEMPQPFFYSIIDKLLSLNNGIE